MNARTFVSNINGVTQRIEITELEKSSGRTVRIMFDSEDAENLGQPLDDVVLSIDIDGNVRIVFYDWFGDRVDRIVGYHKLR